MLQSCADDKHDTLDSFGKQPKQSVFILLLMLHLVFHQQILKGEKKAKVCLPAQFQVIFSLLQRFIFLNAILVVKIAQAE